jgi:hypothetical protein
MTEVGDWTQGCQKKSDDEAMQKQSTLIINLCVCTRCGDIPNGEKSNRQ